MGDIEHRTTKIRSPRTNGFVERMNRTLLDECFRVQGRQTWYIGIDEIQNAVLLVCSGVFQALGKTLPSLLISASRLVLYALPTIWLTSQPDYNLSVISIASSAIVFILPRYVVDRSRVAWPSVGTAARRDRRAARAAIARTNSVVS